MQWKLRAEDELLFRVLVDLWVQVDLDPSPSQQNEEPATNSRTRTESAPKAMTELEPRLNPKA